MNGVLWMINDRKTTWAGSFYLRMLFFLLLFSCLGVFFAQADDRVVTVGFYENAPKVFTSESGKPSGVFIDIIEHIAKKEGWTLRYVHGTWGEGLNRLAKGEIDLMPDVAYSEVRDKIYAFHKVPVLSSWYQVYAAQGSAIRSILDLNRKRILVLERSIPQEAFERLSKGFGLDSTVIPMPDYQSMFAMVARGEADAAITSRFYGMVNAKKFGLEDTSVMFEPSDLYFAAPENAPGDLLEKIDKHLAAMKQDPESVYYASLKRWTSEEVSFKLPAWLQILGSVAVVMLIMSLAGSLVLRRQVTARTRELQTVNQEMERCIIERTAELRTVLEEQKAILDAVSSGIMLVKDRVIVRCNRSLDEIFGYDAGEQIGQSTRIWYHDEASFIAAGEKLYRNVNNGETDRLELPLMRKDGSFFWARVTGRSVNAGDSAQGSVWIIRDITQEREAAEALRVAYAEQQAIFDSATVGIVLIKDRILQRGNRKLHEMFGWAPGEMVGKPTRIWYADEAGWIAGGGEVYEQIWRGEIHSREQQLMRKDGSLFWARLTSHAVDVADHEKGSVWIIEDITAERDAIEAMRKAKELAEDAAQIKADFLANMSHEIRTPMNAIIGLSHLAIKTGLTPHQQEYISKIQSAGQLLLGIINDILDFSKIEAGKLSIEQAEFNLEDSLNHVADLLTEKAGAKGLELIFDIASDIPQNLVGDALRIGQILLNYGNNAIKFTERGEVCITCRVRERSAEDVLLYFSVHDTGIGLTLEQQKMLFQSFQQADMSITRKYGGTGLGLVICKRLAELMGGETGVESEYGVGSTFWFTVRVGVGATQQRQLLPEPDLRGCRVLLVDDNESARLTLHAMLTTMTFRTVSVPSGVAALEALQQADAETDPFEIVFLDWKMPEMDGIETARKTGALGLKTHPPIILVTAFGRDEVVNEANAVGIQTILTKPVTPSMLFDAAIRVLDKKRITSVPASVELSEVEAKLPSIRGARILLVEDNDLNQDVAVGLLKDAGLAVEVADNGQIALEKLQQADYDLVLMDMQMPVMDGVTATRELRRTPRLSNIPVLAMTANVMQQDRDACQTAGMNGYLSKPIEPEQLWKALLTWIPPRHAVEPQTVRACSTVSAVVDIPSITGLDFVIGLRRVLGKKTLYISMLRRFVSGQKDAAEAIRKDLEAGNLESAERRAHSAKGIAGTIGAIRLQECAADLEHSIRQHQPSGIIDAALMLFSVSLSDLVIGLEKFLPPEPDLQLSVIDKVKLATVVEKLGALFRDDDATACDVFEEHAELLQGAFPTDYSSLRSAIKIFDFESALSILERAMKKVESL